MLIVVQKTIELACSFGLWGLNICIFLGAQSHRHLWWCGVTSVFRADFQPEFRLCCGDAAARGVRSKDAAARGGRSGGWGAVLRRIAISTDDGALQKGRRPLQCPARRDM